MSPEIVRLDRAPTGVRALPSEPAAALERIVAGRCEAHRRHGVEQGRAEAVAEGLDLLERATARFEQLSREASAEVARTAVELAGEIARTLLRAEVVAGNYDLERIVRETLADSEVDRGSCVVHVHPSDAERLAEVRFRAGTRIEPDVEVSPGDVRVATPHGLLVRDMRRAVRDIAERILGDLA